MLWVPPGFAHGFLVLSESADFLYKCTEYYSPQAERTIQWNDPQLAIEWPLACGRVAATFCEGCSRRGVRDCGVLPVNVFITGAGGQVGTALVSQLLLAWT